jgi:hypothetical protein
MSSSNSGGSSMAQNLRRQWSVRSENRSIIPGVGMTQRQISLQARSSTGEKDSFFLSSTQKQHTPCNNLTSNIFLLLSPTHPP